MGNRKEYEESVFTVDLLVRKQMLTVEQYASLAPSATLKPGNRKHS
jgi:hypothetical protein